MKRMLAPPAAGLIYIGPSISTGNTIDLARSPYRDLTTKAFLRLGLSASAIEELKQAGELGRRCQCRSLDHYATETTSPSRIIVVKKRVVTSVRSAGRFIKRIFGIAA
jgi:hypothetical protein